MGWVGRLGGDAEMPCCGGWGRWSGRWGRWSVGWGTGERIVWKVERTVAKTHAAGSGVGAGLSVDGEERGAGCGGLAGHHLAVVILEVDEVTFH